MMTKFNLGKVYMTQGINALITDEMSNFKAMQVITRHSQCDFGNLCEEDKAVNNEAIEHKRGMVLSKYKLLDEDVYVITQLCEEDTYTTLLLTHEY